MSAPKASKSKPRAYGSGTITARGPGTWLVQVDLGKDLITGRRARASKTVHGKKGDAQAELTRMLAQRDEDAIDPAKVTVRQMLDAYFDARPNRSPNTIRETRGVVDRYLPEELGRQLITKLPAFQLDKLYRHLEARGGVCRRYTNRCTTKTCPHGKGEPLSAATVARLHTEIHAAYEQAIKWGWCKTNVADLATLTEIVEKHVDVDPDEVIRLLAHIDTLERDTAIAVGGSRLPAFVDALLGTGARVAEVCALQYGQLNLEREVAGNPRPHVTYDASIAQGKGGATRKETKTKKVRYPVLDGYTADVLRRRRSDWLPAALEVGVPLESFHVFPSQRDVRKPIRPDSVSREFRRARDDAGVSDQVTLRNLRHLVASLLVDAGASATTVAGRLGNSAELVQKRYAHMLDSGNANVAAIVNERLGRSS